MKRHLLIITEAGDVYPSGKIRAYIYKDRFVNAGYSVTFKTLLVPFITRMYYKNTAFVKFLRMIGVVMILNGINSKIFRKINLWRISKTANNYDVVYLQKVLSVDLVEKLLKEKKARFVYDLNDGLWLPLWHKHTGGRIEQILKTVDAITCDNPVGVAYAKNLNPNTHLVPDSPQVELFDEYRDKVKRNNNGEIVIGWIGTPGSLFNMYAIFEALEEIFKRHKNIKLRILGGGRSSDVWPPFENVKYEIVHSYTQTELVEEVLKMDIGIFPMFDIENSRARGILKATIYMSGEAAVISSAVGQSNELIQDGVNGMLATDTKSWEEKLEVLITNPELRKRIASKGLETVRAGFSLDQNFKKLQEVL